MGKARFIEDNTALSALLSRMANWPRAVASSSSISAEARVNQMSQQQIPHGRFFHEILSLILRRPSWPKSLLGAGVALILGGLGIGNFAGDLTWIGTGQIFRLGVQTDGGDLPIYWSKVVVIIGFILLMAGFGLGVWDHIVEKRQQRRQRVVVLEHRGLHQTIDTALAAAVPSRLKGRIDVLPIDHRQATRNAQISNPEDALAQISSLRQQLRQKRDAAGPGNVELVYGGMAPVPMTFLAGMMIDNEADVTVMDWDRDQRRWRELDGIDDGDRFTVVDLEALPHGTLEVALAIAVSYPSDIDGIRASLPDMPIIRAYMSTFSTSAHWSASKQSAMVNDFTSILGRLMEKGVRRLHLFIAAPNSVVFNLGRHFDDRLHPDALVYQYERSASPPFPWAVQMPTHGHVAPQIVRLEGRASG